MRPHGDLALGRAPGRIERRRRIPTSGVPVAVDAGHRDLVAVAGFYRITSEVRAARQARQNGDQRKELKAGRDHGHAHVLGESRAGVRGVGRGLLVPVVHHPDALLHAARIDGRHVQA